MDYQQLKATLNASGPLVARLGISVAEVGEGYARVVKTFVPEDSNPIGVPHGGCYFTLADTACGSAMAGLGGRAVTVSASYNFFRSAAAGDVVTAEARKVKAGRTLCVFDVRLTDQSGVLLGSGTFTLCRLSQPSAPENGASK